MIQHMCGYICIGFIDFMLKGNNITDFTNLFSPNNFKKNDDIIKKKKFMAPFYGWGFNCLKARATSRRQFTFYH